MSLDGTVRIAWVLIHLRWVEASQMSHGSSLNGFACLGGVIGRVRWGWGLIGRSVFLGKGDDPESISGKGTVHMTRMTCSALGKYLCQMEVSVWRRR